MRANSVLNRGRDDRNICGKNRRLGVRMEVTDSLIGVRFDDSRPKPDKIRKQGAVLTFAKPDGLERTRKMFEAIRRFE